MQGSGGEGGREGGREKEMTRRKMKGLPRETDHLIEEK